VNARADFARRIAQWTGFDLDRGGRAAVLERLIRSRWKTLGLASADAYVSSLASPENPEVVRLIEALTVGHTWFYRDQEQTEEIGRLFRGGQDAPPVAACWVAGSSTGEEAYTLAMLAEASGARVDILATDINGESLDRARGARYALYAARGVPSALRGFLRPDGPQAVVVDDRVRSRVRFQRHNLLDPPPRPRTGELWPLVVCRNVLIYLRRDAALSVVERLARALAPGGWLFLGAGEILTHAPPGFRLVATRSRVALRRMTDPAEPAPALRGLHVPDSGAQAALLERAALAPPSCVDALLEQAVAKVHGGEHSEAIALCARALENDILLPEAHLISGIALYMSDDPVSAARALRSTLLLDADEWVASFYLALAYEQVGREDDALREYRNTDAASRARRAPSRLPALEAWKDEIATLARARSTR
jgi:chemotaxis protein methyltransferase CheR